MDDLFGRASNWREAIAKGDICRRSHEFTQIYSVVDGLTYVENLGKWEPE